MDSPALASMFDSIQEQHANIHSLLIARHGYLVTEAYFYPFRRDLKHNLHSCTKSITSALVGIAIQEGLIEGVNQPYDPFWQVNGSLALRGFWQDDQTLVLAGQVLGQADSLEIRFTFAKDSVEVQWKGWVEDVSEFATGKLQD